MANKKIVVFGSSGFVGVHLGLYLIQLGHEVVGVDQNEPRVHQGQIPWRTVSLDLETAHDFSGIPFDADCVVFLAAALPLRGSEGTVEAKNLAIGRAFVRYLESRAPKAAVLVSSSSVYDARTSEPFGEGTIPHPRGGYGRSKLSVEEVVGTAARSKGILVTTIRPTPIVGVERNGLFEILRDLIRRGIPVPVTTSPMTRLQVTHLPDLIDLLITEIHTPTGRTWGTGNPDPGTLADYARAIAASNALRPLLFPIPVRVFRGLGKVAVDARLTNLTRWHLEAMTNLHMFDGSMLPPNFQRATPCAEAVVESMSAESI